MPFQPSCIICCSDCDAGGLFTSCQHFLCARCTARYPPGTCPRCRKPCKAVAAGPALPAEVRERLSHDPHRLLAAAAAALDFQRRQERQTLQRLREVVATLNQSNRGMAAQLQAARAEREGLRATVERLQRQIRAPTPLQHAAPSPARGWLASPAAAPLGWSQTKRTRTPTPSAPGRRDAEEAARFRLETPAITLRSAMPGSREATPVHHMGGMSAPKPLQSLLCRAP